MGRTYSAKRKGGHSRKQKLNCHAPGSGRPNKENFPPGMQTEDRPKKPLPQSAEDHAENHAQQSAIIKQLTNQKYEKNRTIKKFKTRVSELEGKVAVLEADNTRLTSINAALYLELAAATGSLEALQNELYSNQEELARTTHLLMSADQELFNLRKETADKILALQGDADRVVDRYVEELEKRRGQSTVLHREIDRLKKRVARGPMQLQRAIIADRMKQARLKKNTLRSKGVYSQVSRSIAVVLERCGCAQRRIGEVLKEISRLLGVPLDFQMSRRTVRRCVLEVGVAATIQVGHMLSKAICKCD